MSQVQLADVIDIEIYNALPMNESPTKTRIFASGMVNQNPLLDGLASGVDDYPHLPFWNDLAETEPNISSDNPAQTSTPEKITQSEQRGRRSSLNNSWSAMDLVSEFGLGDRAMEAIRSRVDAYWDKVWQRRLTSCIAGIVADNVANDGGDMVVDISRPDGNSATAANLFGRSAVIDTALTLGDSLADVTAMAVHSVVYGTMLKNDDIDFIPDSDGNMTIPTYLGKLVIVDDGMPVVAGGTNGFVYTSALYGAGAFGYGNGSPAVPTAIDRKEDAGNGAGQEFLHSRRTFLLHPFGFSFTNASVAAQSPTEAELRAGANWNRVIERKNVPLAFLLTNG
ncbi:MAG: major capsid protein [Pseudomonadota bacterium]